MKKIKMCTTIPTAAGRCRTCSEYIAEDVHVHGTENEPVAIYCVGCCPECTGAPVVSRCNESRDNDKDMVPHIFVSS